MDLVFVHVVGLPSDPMEERGQAAGPTTLYARTKDGKMLSLTVNTEANESWLPLWIPVLEVFNQKTMVAVDPAPIFEWLQSLCDATGYILPLNGTLSLTTLGSILFPQSTDTLFPTLCHQAGVGSVPDTLDGTASVSVLASFLKACEHKALQRIPYMTLQQMAQLASLSLPMEAAWFAEVSEQRFQTEGTTLPSGISQIQQLAFTTPHTEEADEGFDVNEEHTVEGLDTGELSAVSSSFLDDGSPLKQWMPGFEVRSGQREMVHAVADALSGDMHLVVEAGTGTGKSLAYLIPSALYALESDARVVVSTHTISLQDQIANRDFPLLRKAIPRPLALSVFKGRTHYVCMRKMLQEIRMVGFAGTPDDVTSYLSLLVWLTETAEGSREELRVQGFLGDLWPRIQSETETCINKRCPFFKPCYYFRARTKAYESDIIVTNHSLLLSDIKAEHRVLPRYDKLIIDEAHHLEEQATKHLGEEVHLHRTLSLLQRVVRDGGKSGVIPELLTRIQGTTTKAATVAPVLEQMQEALILLRSWVDTAFQILASWVPSGANDVRITRALASASSWDEYVSVAGDMSSLVQDLESWSAKVSETAEQETDEDLAGRMFDAIGFLQEVYHAVYVLGSAVDVSDDWVGWVETSRAGRYQNISLHKAPIDVARLLQQSLFDSKSTVVLTSATLSANGSFDHVKRRLGLLEAERDGRFSSTVVPSPFSFDKQAMICVPTDVPELAKIPTEHAAVWLSDALYHYASISRGRLLALFTSHAQLRATAEGLREPLTKAGLRLYAQGIDGSRTAILESFRAHPNSVLLGAQSFWEGIDLPGDQLTTLVIVRLPFSPPTHPVTQARHERMQQEGWNPFAHDSLPEAIVRFRQGFGRLIRTINDKGVVVVLDKRIISARYGIQFLKSVPGVQRCIGPESQVTSEIRRFLSQ